MAVWLPRRMLPLTLTGVALLLLKVTFCWEDLTMTAVFAGITFPAGISVSRA